MATETRDLVAFEADGTALRVRDALHGGTLTVDADREVNPRPALTELFAFPVDDAVSFRADRLTISPHNGAALRDDEGEDLGVFSETRVEKPTGTYVLDVSGPMKLYIRIPDVALAGSYDQCASNDAELRVAFDEARTVTVGARSLHERPQATMTVPDDPTALARAFSHLGSSIKEFSPERSWPTLRGHPPAIRRGDELRIPEGITRPETGVTLRVPPTYATLYEVAPLAFYLGADVVPGDDPELVLANGYTEPLVTPTAGLAERVDGLLRRTLLLDSLVRVGGYYATPRYEYEEIAGELPFYPQELYDASLTDQLMEYLEISPSLLAPYLPDRPLRATLRNGPDDAELVPHLVNDLASIAVDRGEGAPPGSPSDHDAVAVGHTDGPILPAETRLVREAYESALDRTPRDVSNARILFVVGDEAADSWRRVRDAATSRIDPPVAVADLLVAPSGEEVAAALGDDYDLVWCLLPAVDGGIECADGVLPPAAVEEVTAWGLHVWGPDALDVSTSLCERGAVTALATADRQSPATAERLLRCLFRGHGFAQAGQFVGREELGDFWTAGARPRSVTRRAGGAAPLRVSVVSESEDDHRVTLWTPLVAENRLGSEIVLHANYTADSFQLAGSAVEHPLGVDTETVTEILSDSDYVVTFNGDPYHGDREATPRFVRDAAKGRLDAHSPN